MKVLIVFDQLSGIIIVLCLLSKEFSCFLHLNVIVDSLFNYQGFWTFSHRDPSMTTV